MGREISWHCYMLDDFMLGSTGDYRGRCVQYIQRPMLFVTPPSKVRRTGEKSIWCLSVTLKCGDVAGWRGAQRRGVDRREERRVSEKRGEERREEERRDF